MKECFFTPTVSALGEITEKRSKFIAAPRRNKFWESQEGLQSNFKSFREDTIEICTLKLNGVFYRIQYSCGFLKLHFSFL